MNKLREFIIKDVRCFEGEQRADIRPITLLIGENSTGKTSFLGSYRILHQALSGHKYTQSMMREHLNFNAEPFEMGAFRDIFRSKRGRSNGKDNFMLGCSVGDGNKKYGALLTFIEKGFEPIVSSLRFLTPNKSHLEIRMSQNQNIVIEIPNHTIETNFSSYNTHVVFLLLDEFLTHPEMVLDLFGLKKEDIKILGDFIKREFTMRPKSKENRRSARYPWRYYDLGREQSIAPLRSKPERTYNPTDESPTSEGKHIPMLMMRLLRTKDKDWDTLHDDLVEFGDQSGLFSGIGIKSHGKQINDPFQLRVKVRKGPQSNIIDVGYGVNQILPILVEIMRSEQTTFLLQQPEVHLHPQAQAGLSTFLAKSVAKKNHSFLIETHSDYIIDRMRISVRDETISPDDVSILYFEPEKRGGAVKIHNIKIDKQGNLIDAPPGYRDFFMKENDKLLGFS